MKGVALLWETGGFSFLLFFDFFRSNKNYNNLVRFLYFIYLHL